MSDPRHLRVVARVAHLLRSVEARREFVRRRMHRFLAWDAALAKTSALRVRKVLRAGETLVGIGLVEHMGDIVAAEPILRQLRRDHPQARIVWFARAPFRELLELSPHLSRVLVVSCLTEWIHLRRSHVFDRIVDLHGQGRQCPVCRLALRRPEGNQAITFDNYYHFGSLLDVMLQYTDVAVADRQPRLETPRPVRDAVDRLALPPRYVAIHCTANEASRNWNADGWRDLVAALAAGGAPDIVEVGLVPVVAGAAAPDVVDLCGSLTMPEMAEVIRRAALFVGIDSGPAHVANAVGTPGVVLLGAYRDFGRYMPYSGGYESGANATIVYEPSGLQNLPAPTVFSAVRRRLGQERSRASASAE